MKLWHRLLDFHVRKYIRNNPSQLRKLGEFDFRPKRFLVISHAALGDTLLSTPAIKSLRESFPEARIAALVHKKTEPLFRHFRYLDRIVIDHGGHRKFFQTAKALREEAPEMALILHGNGPEDIALAILSGANFILKHPTKSPYKKYLSCDFEQKYQHVIEDRMDLIRKIGGAAVAGPMEIPPLDDGDREEKVSGLLGPGADFIGFQIGAAERYKIWPVGNFTALAGMILNNNKSAKIVVTGIDKEAGLARKIADACGDRVINSCGRFRIDELPYLINRLKLLVTNDTGTMHLAIALKVPTISLFSSTDRNVTGPYQDPEIHTVIQKCSGSATNLPKKQRDNSDMKLISADEVFAAYKSFVHNILI